MNLPANTSPAPALPVKAPVYITTGEPAGIGPEIALQAAVELAGGNSFTVNDIPVVLLGNLPMLQERARSLGLPVQLASITPDQYGSLPLPSAGGQISVPVLDIPLGVPAIPGQLDTGNAAHVLNQLETAARHAEDGTAAAIVTAPVQKSVINDAGIPFTGHTEFFQQHAGVERVVMMLASHHLRVALATTHLPLRDVADAITPELLREVLEILLYDLQERFGITRPKLLVCGLNPHAGESGHLGREEIDIINPVLQEFRNRGFQVGHALPADTLFTARNLAGADAVLAMYHDQGLPVLKHSGFGEAVNITLGLPYIRTSVDHGTALDLAGTGRADTGSLKEALLMASELAANTSHDAGAEKTLS